MTIRHRNGAYPIVFTSLAVALEAIPVAARVITDQNLAGLYSEPLSRFKHVQTLPSGEQSKSIKEYLTTLQWLASTGMTRGETVLAFGGGVVGDLAGFVAATYMRGVTLIQIPTTLLAMVDSSVGGKVGIDLPQGKNLVGSFKPPHTVYICNQVLDTLPSREFMSGMAEVLKYGFIMDAPMARSLAESPLASGDSRMSQVVRTCITHKAFVVERDEFETSGLRATLNFGHTVGHAIEKLQGYSDWTHGEAIAAGMVAECAIAEAIGFAPTATSAFIESSLREHGLPTRLPKDFSAEQIVESMKLDKKAGREGIALSLVAELGTCKLMPSVNEEKVRRALDEFIQR